LAAFDFASAVPRRSAIAAAPAAAIISVARRLQGVAMVSTVGFPPLASFLAR
jgi:hypothetical protein